MVSNILIGQLYGILQLLWNDETWCHSSLLTGLTCAERGVMSSSARRETVGSTGQDS